MTIAARPLVAALLAAAVVGAGCDPTADGDGGVAAPPADEVPAATAAPTTGTPTDAAPSGVPTVAAPGVDGPDGSGCAPGEGALPDGRWFGFVQTAGNGGLEFDLACWFSGEAAVAAAAEDGAESPPPNDYYIRNQNPTFRVVAVAPDTTVVWYPQVGDPDSEVTTSYTAWRTNRDDEPTFPLGVWLDVVDARATSIAEQWVP